MKPDPRALQHITDAALQRAADMTMKRLIARIPATAPRVRPSTADSFIVASSEGHNHYYVQPDSCTCAYFNDNPPVHNGRKVCKHTLTVRALIALMEKDLRHHICAGDSRAALEYALAHPWTVLLATPFGAETCKLYDPGTGFAVAARLVHGLYTADNPYDLAWLYQWWIWATELPPAELLPAHEEAAAPAAVPVAVPVAAPALVPA